MHLLIAICNLKTNCCSRPTAFRVLFSILMRIIPFQILEQTSSVQVHLILHNSLSSITRQNDRVTRSFYLGKYIMLSQQKSQNSRCNQNISFLDTLKIFLIEISSLFVCLLDFTIILYILMNVCSTVCSHSKQSSFQLLFNSEQYKFCKDTFQQMSFNSCSSQLTTTATPSCTIDGDAYKLVEYFPTYRVGLEKNKNNTC